MASAQDKSIYTALPKLPHFNFHELHEPARHGRRQFCFRNDDGTRTVVTDSPGRSGAEGDAVKSGCGIPVRVVLDHFPEWKTLDDKVLRFFGYYVETVDESMIEECRVRKVKLCYFLGNGTLTITETPAVANSGLRAGTTVSRFKEEGVDVFSLCIGGTLPCRGLAYHLVDCDAATREFFAVMGMPQPDPLDYPFDAFEDRALRPPPPMDEHHIALRRAVEVQAAMTVGTHASLLTPDERAIARSFFEHDREVLRFYAVWDAREFRVNYYLADGTISVMFDPAENDGRDRNAVFARRTRIPKDTRDALLHTETLNRPLGAPRAFLTAEDLRTGATVDIYARPFFLYDCDPHTRAYLQARGIDASAYPRPPTERDLYEASRRRPQLQGGASTAKEGAAAGSAKKFGASSMVFEDHANEKDALQMTRFSQDVFRFGGRMATPAPADEGRRFIISYYLADDTVSVYEILIHNTGHLGGKMFARRAVPGIDEPRKLSVGATVRLDSVDYVLEEMDERTRQYLAAGMPHMEESYFHTLDLIAKAQQATLQTFSRSTDAFRHYASSSTQGLTRDNVREVLGDGGVRVTEEELDRVMARVDGDRDGWVSLADFTEHFMNQQFMSDFVPRDPASRARPLGAATVIQRGPIRSAQAIAQRENAAACAEAALRQFMLRTEARRTLLIRAFRGVASESYDGHIGMEDFADCVAQRLKLQMADDELGALLYKFFYTPGVTNWMARRLSTNEVERLIKL